MTLDSAWTAFDRVAERDRDVSILDQFAADAGRRERFTLEAAGLDMTNFASTGAAIVHATHGDPFPRMIWPTNETKLASATMFSLFFGGNDFAPRTRVDGEPIQEYLQGHYLAAVQQVAIALLVVEAVGGDLRGAIDALAHAPRTPGRLVPHASPSGALVIDDSYNANPRSMRAALEFAASIAAQRGGRAFAVLGEMKELGAASEDAHAEIVEIPGVEIFAVGEAFARALEVGLGERHDPRALHPRGGRRPSSRGEVAVLRWAA